MKALQPFAVLDVSARRRAGLAIVGALAWSWPSTPAWALSEIQREELSPPQSGQSLPRPDTSTIPLPEPPLNLPPIGEPEESEPAQPEPGEEGEGIESSRPDVDPEAPLPEIITNLDRLPEPVRRMRDLIVEACKSGEIERLRPLLGTGDGATQLSLGGLDGDPIAFLKELAGDAEGQEILAIMEEVLSAGYVHLDAGTPEELYVWPYFFGLPLDRLDARQRVELFKIVTAGDYEDMKNFGSYIFYRVGISPQGEWAFFVAGE